MLRRLDSSEENIIEYEVTDKITEEENDQMLGELRNLIEMYGTIKVFVRAHSIPTPELSAVSERLSFAKEHLDKIEKYALVTDSRILTALENLIDPATKMELKVFPPEKEEEARAWLRDFTMGETRNISEDLKE
jgi:hypothetical protein